MAIEALERLREGNRRFVAGEGDPDGPSHPHRRAELLGGQQPFAIVLGCSDSRVPVEIVLGQRLQDLLTRQSCLRPVRIPQLLGVHLSDLAR